MAPSDFIQARQQRPQLTTLTLDDPETKSDEFFRVAIDDKPYFPFLHVVEDDSSGSWVPSCQRAVAAVFGLSEESSAGSLTVKPVLGGNTNVLFCVSKSNDDTTDKLPEKVLVRIFGGHGLIDRDIETSTYAALAVQGLALPYYGRFGNGRIEGWSDWQCLKEEGMRDCSIPIARCMATLHSTFQIPSKLQEYHNPTQTPTMWVQLNDWIKTAVPATFQTPSDTERAKALKLELWQGELAFLKEQVIAKEAAVGFCHNDVLASNIMFDHQSSTKQEQQVQLIDFEYGGMNYLSYDIANHFNEYAGGTDASATPNYDQFPSREVQKAFVTEYLSTQRRLFQKDSQTTTAQSDVEVVELFMEISGFILANHLVWALWAVNQASTEGCARFDYLKYALNRMKRYFEDKKQWEEDRTSTSAC
jgi:thiamine kinase-like enzyme